MTLHANTHSTVDPPVAERRVYLYCVGRSDALEELGPVGIGGERVRVVRHDGLAGLVSDVPANARVHAGMPSRASLLAHEFVSGAAMRRRTVIPVAYGMVFRSDADVGVVLAATHDGIEGALDALADRVQVGLRLVWLEGAESGGARDLVDETYETLREVATANRTRAPIGERMLRNVCFLVDRENLPAFAERVAALRTRRGALLEYRLSGPSAPSDFVRVRLRVDRPEEPAGAPASA